jgi:hypothetical protein
MGDLNAHHQWWYGSEQPILHKLTRKHSERIVDWLEQYDFSLHNAPGTYTHFPRQSGASPSIIDLTTGQPQPKRFWAKTNWKIFEETIKESGIDLSALASKTETLRACTNIHSLINKIDIAVPLITPKIKFGAWTKDLSTLRQTLRKHERISRRRPSDRTLPDRCRKLRQEWQSAIRTAKHSYWINKLETTDRDTIWKTISKK